MIYINDLIEELNKGLTIKELSNLFNVSVSTIKRKMIQNNLKSQSRDFKNKSYICIECKLEFLSKDKNRKFCSKKCSIDNNFKILSDNREEINKKISNKLNKIVIVKCLECNNDFQRKRKFQTFCSRSCATKNVANREEIKKLKSDLFKKITKERHENGDTSIGWQKRDILTPSYPEKITIDLLNDSLIEYEYEKKVGKYFIDFAFNNKMIALEIDGRTHDDIEVKQKDIRKDDFLTKNGWFVYRIKWTNTKDHYKKINDFIEKYIS